MKNETLLGEPDGLETPEAGSYTEDKYALIRLYCDLFSKGMSYKWRGKRVYLDLYAGAGKCRIKGTERILLGSPLIAMSVESPFDRYVLCESDPVRVDALKQRVCALGGDHNVYWIESDCNEAVPAIRKAIPSDSLVLCFVDPFDCDIRHDTLKALAAAAYGVDFLCLLAFQMDAKRNTAHYLLPENHKIDGMLGNVEWRDRWENERLKGVDFARFLAMEFALSMEGIGYQKTETHDMRLIKTLDRNVPLYYLALFSKHPRAFSFWKQVLKYATPQRGLFD